jgi:hypothetical protein
LTTNELSRSGAGYSADVRIELHIGGHVHFPSHTGPDFLIFREPQSLPATTARLAISVDGVIRTSTVEILPYAAPATRVPVRIAGKQA